MTVRNPEVVAESIVGEDVSVAVSDVWLMETRRFSATNTFSFVMVAIGIAGVLAIVGHVADCRRNHCR